MKKKYVIATINFVAFMVAIIPTNIIISGLAGFIYGVTLSNLVRRIKEE